jgi:hypothetical protein
MNKDTLYCGAAAVMLLLSLDVEAQAPIDLPTLVKEIRCENKPGAVPSRYIRTAFSWENDFFGNSVRALLKSANLGHEGDRWYTNGMRFERLSHPLCQKPNRYLSRIADHLPISATAHRFDGYALGMNMYTPEKIETPAANPLDRPYSGWLYYGKQLVAEDIAGGRRNQLHQLELQLGLLGEWSLQENAQKGMHALIGDNPPLGWQHQQRGRLGANLLYRGMIRSHRLANFYYRYEAALGNVKTYVSGGFEVNWVLASNAARLQLPRGAGEDFALGPRDWVISPALVLAKDPESSLPSAKADHTEQQLLSRWKKLAAERVRWKKLSEFKLFFDFSAQWVIYNTFLDNRYTAMDYRIEKEPLVFDYRAGLSWKCKNAYPVWSLSFDYRTKEFTRPGPDPSDYFFGRVQWEWLWE